MNRFPGHLRAEAPIRVEALHLLTAEYDRYEPFVDACAQFKMRGALTQNTEPTLCELEDYYKDETVVEAFAKRWNVDRIPEMREGGCYRLRGAIEQVGRTIGGIACRPFQPAPFFATWDPEDPIVTHGDRRWAWRLGSFETLAECRDRIASDLDVSVAAIPLEVSDQLRALPDEAGRLGWRLVDVPHGLLTHVRWLFLRLCPQPDRPLGPQVIAKRESDYTDPRTVRRAVVALAEAMHIELPPLAPGRRRRGRIAAAL